MIQIPVYIQWKTKDNIFKVPIKFGLINPSTNG